MDRYSEIPHTADLAAEIYGKDLRELFANAAYAMFDIMASDMPDTGSEKTAVEVTAPDTESLLIAWLNELLFLSFERKMVFFGFSFTVLEPGRLEAGVSGVSYEGKRILRKEIKAATYHDIKIKKTSSGYKVRVVFDV